MESAIFSRHANILGLIFRRLALRCLPCRKLMFDAFYGNCLNRLHTQSNATQKTIQTIRQQLTLANNRKNLIETVFKHGPSKFCPTKTVDCKINKFNPWVRYMRLQYYERRSGYPQFLPSLNELQSVSKKHVDNKKNSKLKVQVEDYKEANNRNASTQNVSSIKAAMRKTISAISTASINIAKLNSKKSEQKKLDQSSNKTLTSQSVDKHSQNGVHLRAKLAKVAKNAQILSDKKKRNSSRSSQYTMKIDIATNGRDTNSQQVQSIRASQTSHARHAAYQTAKLNPTTGARIRAKAKASTTNTNESKPNESSNRTTPPKSASAKYGKTIDSLRKRNCCC